MIQIIKKADLSFLHEALDECESFMKEEGCDPVSIGEVQLIIEELFTNTVYYAYSNSDHEPICIFNIDLQDNDLTIERIDYGYEFNPVNIASPDTTLPSEKRKIGGLGMHLVRSYTDSMEYRREDRKNILTLHKTIKKEQD